MHTTWQDIRYALRQLIKTPGFTLAAVACLALGIGANSAAFSFARAFLFQNAPIEEPERLVRMYLSYKNGIDYGAWSYPDLVDLQALSPELFEGAAGDGVALFSLSAGGTNQRLFGYYVTANYFDLLGVTPAQGRAFLPEEGVTEGTHPVVILSHGLWQRAFAGDPAVVGADVLLNGHELTVVGVAPEGFVGHNTGIGAELWVPMQMVPTLDSLRGIDVRGNHWIMSATVRLRPGVTPEQAKQVVDAMYQRHEELYPDTSTGITVRVYREGQAAMHPAIRRGFVAMLSLIGAVVGFVLLLACANVAGLLLARAAARRREIGIRLALGAGRLRLVRQLLTESMTLALLGGGLGLALGVGLLELVGTLKPPTELPLHTEVPLDGTVLLFALAASVLTGVVFGLVPALQTTRQDLVLALKDGTPGAGGQTSRLRKGLVIGQVALSMMLLVAAAIALRSLGEVRGMDVGFQPDGAVVASLDPGMQGYDEARVLLFWDELRAALQGAPGVEAVGYSDSIPLSLSSSQSSVLPEGYEVPEGQGWPSLDRAEVEHGFFAAMGVPLLRGRAFEPTDDADAPPVMLVNEAFASRFWPGQDPLGKSVQHSGREHRVIGLVPTGKYFGLTEDPKPFYYRHSPQHVDAAGRYLVVRTSGDASALIGPVRDAVARLDSTLPTGLQTLRQSLGLAYMPVVMASSVLTGFAALALLLAAVGLYGVISFGVSQQVREIGVRMALGASARSVLQLVLRSGLTLVAVGLVFGLGGGLMLTRLAARVLYGVSATDPLAYLTSIAVLALAALAATLLPALRATRIDPLTALRSE